MNESFLRQTKSVPRPLGSGPRWPLPNGRGTAILSPMTAWGIIYQSTDEPDLSAADMRGDDQHALFIRLVGLSLIDPAHPTSTVLLHFKLANVTVSA